jgi:hypothetical protein
MNTTLQCIACGDTFMTPEAAASHTSGEFVETLDREVWMLEDHQVEVIA